MRKRMRKRRRGQRPLREAPLAALLLEKGLLGVAVLDPALVLERGEQQQDSPPWDAHNLKALLLAEEVLVRAQGRQVGYRGECAESA